LSSLVHSIPYAAFSKVGINAAEPQAGLPCSLIIKLSPLDTPSKLGKCLSPSASHLVYAY
jgi:hypothetical protein